MTASTVTAPAPASGAVRRGRPDDDALQLIAVLVTAAVAIAAGWLIVTASTPGPRRVEMGGISATVPPGWIVRPGAGDVVLVATDPRDPGVRISISRPEAATPLTPASVADRRIAARAALLDAFSVLSRDALPGDVTGETVDFTWAATPDGEPVISMQGREEVTARDGRVTVISVESPTESVDAARSAFEAFAASIEEVAS